MLPGAEETGAGPGLAVALCGQGKKRVRDAQTALVRGAKGCVFPPVWFLIQGRKLLRGGSEVGEDGLLGPSQNHPRHQKLLLCLWPKGFRDTGT